MEILGRRSVYILALSRNLFILLLLDTFFLVFSFINVLFKKSNTYENMCLVAYVNY